MKQSMPLTIEQMVACQLSKRQRWAFFGRWRGSSKKCIKTLQESQYVF